MFSPALVLPSVALALLLGPPNGPRPPVQSPETPAMSPTQPHAGEPAIAPALVEGEPAVAEPLAPVSIEPTPELQPTEPQPTEPQPEGELPSWQGSTSTPFTPSSDLPPTEGDPVEAPLLDEWGTPLPPPEKQFPPKGTGFYAAAGALFGAMITKQLVMGLTCDDVYCGWRGNMDRGLGLGVMGLAAGGGWFQGRRSAAVLHDAGKPAKPLTGRRAAGWTMFAVGLGGLIADAVLYNICYSSALGPYTQLEGFKYECSPVASVVIVDFSTLIGAAGMGMGLGAESQRRHHEKYESARAGRVQWAVSPWGGRGQAGLSFSGRF
jgi:hypothetical protein